jgi:hypothetical protein
VIESWMWDRRLVPTPMPAGLVVVTRRARRKKARYLGRSGAVSVPVAYWIGVPWEGCQREVSRHRGEAL